MVGRQVDKVILFPSKRGSKCGKMDKKEAPDAEALIASAPGVFSAYYLIYIGNQGMQLFQGILLK